MVVSSASKTPVVTATVGLGSPPFEEPGRRGPGGVSKTPVIGVLALQGDFREHREMMSNLGFDAVEVRNSNDLKPVDALILPGGESTAMSRLLSTSGLFEEVDARLRNGSLATFGTCAGMILSAARLVDGVPEQRGFQHFDATVRRNGIGRQIASCEEEIHVSGMDAPFLAVFIRPPVVEQPNSSVEVLAEWRGHPVLCRQGKHLFSTFHPELTDDTRIHQMFVDALME